MAWRGRGGRGRGRGGSFLQERFGTTGDTLIPPPLFPPLKFKPTPLKSGSDYDYMMKVKEDLKADWKDNLRHLFKEEKKKDIERYSDKYSNLPIQESGDWDIDFNRIPKELRPRLKRKAKIIPVIKPKKNLKRLDQSVISKTLEELEKKEANEKDDVDGDVEVEKKKGEDDEDNDEEKFDYDDSDNEEDNDYIENYFDNGEGFGDDSDGSGGEAIF